MDLLLNKLNYNGNDNIVIFNMPEEFSDFEKSIGKEVKIYKNNTAIKTEFILVFLKTKSELDNFITKNKEYLLSFEDDLIWFAYPKGTSKRYIGKTNLTRDKNWDSLSALGYKAVRMISIDSDWTAFRVRNLKYIKKK